LFYLSRPIVGVLPQQLLQKELAAEIGVTGDTIVNWEKDRTFPSKTWIKLLTQYFGVREKSFLRYGLEKRSVN
jgi:DNA-binding XRE family transcriptional regulator